MEGEKVLIGLSGGINSMAVLCWLHEEAITPSELHLYYAHFAEHSPDTFQFVAAGIRFARQIFKNVKVKITRNSANSFFEEQGMIPHPMLSPCSGLLKIEPIKKYAAENDIKIDLVGYVKEELKRRANRQPSGELEKKYPIGSFDNEWCFDMVKTYIGWYPFIYDIRYTKDDLQEGLCKEWQIGQRIFKHNNCLPCKNMTATQIMAVKKHFPSYYEAAMRTAGKIGGYYGRNRDLFYSTFGRDLGQEDTCEQCKW